jgi:hypothetical protein
LKERTVFALSKGCPSKERSVVSEFPIDYIHVTDCEVELIEDVEEPAASDREQRKHRVQMVRRFGKKNSIYPQAGKFMGR